MWKVALGGIAALSVAGLTTLGIVSPSSAEDVQPSIVEDFDYPGASQVEAELGIKLIKGDGHIMLADCGANPSNPPADLILVQSNDFSLPSGRNFCFRANGASGYLTVEIPKVYFVRGDDTHTVAAKVEVKDDPTVVETEQVDPGEWQPLGVGQSRGDANLLELRYPFAS
ncbi:hypothetical protein [Salinispora fenicalii]|uniref:hypothetical protein n=1 Tax=Salinispora fenicalii TaxID=1137263 RepID=UPI001CC73C9C|nr:hypothetical protein [Salinispora fenicalii]